MKFKEWAINEEILSLLAIADRLKKPIVQIAQNVCNLRQYGGLCSYIAESVVKTLSPKLKSYGIGITEYWGPEGFKFNGRDHVSVAIYRHSTKEAVEIDIPDSNYQTKTGDNYKKLTNVFLSTKNVVITSLEYSQFSED